MKRILTFSGRFALTGVAAATLLLAAQGAWALGLGRVQVQSALGESLRAEIDVTSLSPEEASNLKVRVAPPESYRSAGVEYNPVLPGTQVSLQRRADGRAFLRLSSDRGVQEPFVDVILEITWSSGRLVREYTLLFDPPVVARTTAPAPAAPVMAPRMAPAPMIAAQPVPAAPAPRQPALPRPAVTATPSVAPRSEPKPALAAADEYRVKSGDTLYRIATRAQRSGVSLDQMLVALYRSNPQAFMGNNMNRLKAGAVLSLPNTEAAGGVPETEAREVIQAQSADFGAYRQRLAGVVPQATTEGTTRQASGKVQASVDDRRQGAAPTPDKLTLSKGSAAAKSAAAAASVSKDQEKKAADARVAELSKNVDELKKLAGATAAAAAASQTVAASPAAPVPAASAAIPGPAVAAAAASAAEAPAVAASVPAIAVAAAPALPASVAPQASAPVAAASVATAAPAPAVEEPGILGSLLEDNPLAVGLGGLAILLLAGFGVYRFARRSRHDSGETSFLESRLQPDSFFGASGGQRIDTRDAGGASSSMSYSLSQLDAIGDVDPVAEADVYLAYGRDLQAEEILKEAMRSSPERMAIRTKLLEVYAKRRDTKGFELLATQLYSLTRGEGEDWAKAQELGAEIDPENPLFQPGGMPVPALGRGGEVVEPLGASTMPQSVLPSPSKFAASASGEMALDSGSMDLDLDLGDPQAGAPTSPSALEATQAFPPEPHLAEDDRADDRSNSLDFVVPEMPQTLDRPATTTAAPATPPEPFDLSDISLDLDLPPESGHGALPAASHAAGSPLDGLELPSLEDSGSDDPLVRKLELAEEFRQIGDADGARDLLQEVVAKANGALKSRAQSMLADLG